MEMIDKLSPSAIGMLIFGVVILYGSLGRHIYIALNAEKKK